MKKIFSLICALCLGAVAQAQIITSTSSNVIREQKVSKTTSYVRLGLNMMNMTGDGAEDLGSKAGYDFSYGFQKAMGSKGGYWGMEVGLSSRGYSYEEGDYEQSLMAHNIYYVPFQFGWKFNVGHNITIDPHIGAFLSGDYAGKLKVEYDGESEDANISDIEDYQYVDAGLKLGVGVWYKRLNLDLSYQKGFVEVIKDGEITSSNFQIRLGVAF